MVTEHFRVSVAQVIILIPHLAFATICFERPLAHHTEFPCFSHITIFETCHKWSPIIFPVILSGHLGEVQLHSILLTEELPDFIFLYLALYTRSLNLLTCTQNHCLTGYFERVLRPSIVIKDLCRKLSCTSQWKRKPGKLGLSPSHPAWLCYFCFTGSTQEYSSSISLHFKRKVSNMQSYYEAKCKVTK